MIGLIICLILLVACLTFYISRKYAHALIILTFFLNYGFFLPGFDSGMPVKIEDFGYLFIIGAFLLFLPHKGFLRLKKDFVAKFVVFFEAYITLRLLYTIYSGEESANYAIKIYRNYLFFWGYFLLRRIPYEEFVKYFKVLIPISFCLGVVYYLQGIGIRITPPQEEEDYGEYKRFVGIIFSCHFMLLYYAVAYHGKIKTKIANVLYYAIMIILGQHRGRMISSLVSIPILFVVRKNAKALRGFAIMALVLGLAFSPILIYRLQAGGGGDSAGTLEQLQEARDISAVANPQHGGSFIVRMFLVYERLNYLTESPNELIWGCGLMHEDSKKTLLKFNFITGSDKVDNNKILVRQQIDTKDVEFISDLMRIGLVGVSLYFFVIIGLMRYFKKHECPISDLAFTLLLYALINSFSGREFTPYFYLFVFASYLCVKQIKTDKEQYFKYKF